MSLVFGRAGNESVDQRVVVAQVDRKTELMLYRPVSGPKKPYTFKSPVSSETFDYVAPMTRSRVFFIRFSKGYVADITIPWVELGYTAASKVIPFDVQVISSDGSGSANASCIWWHSAGADAHANNDIPTEARLYLGQWGRLVLDGR